MRDQVGFTQGEKCPGILGALYAGSPLGGKVMGSDFQMLMVFVSSLVFFVTPGIAALISLFRHPEDFELKKKPLVRVRRHSSRAI